MDSCSLIDGSWKTLLVLLRDGFPDLSALRFAEIKYENVELEPCTVWDGRPIIGTWSLNTPTTSTLQEYIWVNCVEHDFFTILQEIIEEKGIRQALHDMVAGYREVEREREITPVALSAWRKVKWAFPQS